jgi:hypothetical protein
MGMEHSSRSKAGSHQWVGPSPKSLETPRKTGALVWGEPLRLSEPNCSLPCPVPEPIPYGYTNRSGEWRCEEGGPHMPRLVIIWGSFSVGRSEMGRCCLKSWTARLSFLPGPGCCTLRYVEVEYAWGIPCTPKLCVSQPPSDGSRFQTLSCQAIRARPN